MSSNKASRLLQRFSGRIGPRGRGPATSPQRHAPLIHEMVDGETDLARLDLELVRDFAFSRLCGHCGTSLDPVIVFVGTLSELDAGAFTRPAMHEHCSAVALSHYLSAPWSPPHWVALATGSFTVDERAGAERPGPRLRPGGPVWLRQHSRVPDGGSTVVQVT